MKMDRLTITQPIKVIKTYYKYYDSVTATYLALKGDYELHTRPTTQAIGKIVKKFEDTGVLLVSLKILCVSEIVLKV